MLARMTTPDNTSASETSSGLGRRSVLRSAGVVGGAAAAIAALAACSSPGSSASGAGGAAGTTGGGSTAGKIATAKVPVGSGVIDNDLKAVVTQPVKGEFKAFSYVCTHQGCPVTRITGDTIICPCHGSEFSTKDGSVKQGPATQPLTAMTAKVHGSQVIVS